MMQIESDVLDIDGAMKLLMHIWVMELWSVCSFYRIGHVSRLETYLNACMYDYVERTTCMIVDVEPCCTSSVDFRLLNYFVVHYLYMSYDCEFLNMLVNC